MSSCSNPVWQQLKLVKPESSLEVGHTVVEASDQEVDTMFSPLDAVAT